MCKWDVHSYGSCKFDQTDWLDIGLACSMTSSLLIMQYTPNATL